MVNAPFTVRALCARTVRSSVLETATRARSGLSAAAPFVLSLFLGALLSAPAAFAQDGNDDPFAGIEEMVVVGTAASSLFQNQEVSAIAFDEDYLEAIGASDISDVAQFTPNLEIRTPFAASNPTLFIRGVGIRDFNANSSSSVAVYNDEVYMNSPAGQLAQLFDVENIDVLRGPQTTMYGRNANAGTIRVITRKPTGTPGVTGTVTYGRFQQFEFETAVENVIIPDRLTMRTAARWNQRRGTTKNRCADIDYAVLPPGLRADGRTDEGRQAGLLIGANSQCFDTENTSPINSPPGNGWTRGQPAPVKEWVNDVKNWAARTIFRYQHEFLDMDWTLNLHGGQNRGDARQFQMIAADQLQIETEPGPAVGNRDADQYVDADNRWVFRNRRQSGVIFSPFQGNPYEGDYNNVEKEKIDLFGANVTGEMTFGDYSLTLVTGYEWNKRATQINLDGNPFASLEPFLSNSAYQLTNEARLDWDDGGGFSWQLGGMFLYEGLEVNNIFSLAIALPEIDQDYTFFTRYTAVWGKFEWNPVETFKLAAGARFNYENKEINLSSQRFRVRLGIGGRVPLRYPSGSPQAGEVIPPRTAGGHAEEFGWAGDVTLTYSPAADVNFYGRYARGWKGPHINGGVVSPPRPRPTRRG